MTVKKKVIVDTDFMRYLNRPTDGSGIEILEKIIDDLDIELVVHEFLYNKEMMGDPLVKKLKEDELLTVIEYDEFVDESMEILYEKLCEDLYAYLNGRNLDWKGNSYRTYQESEANLGEIHCIILAMFTGYDIIFSNDKGAKTLAKVKVNTSGYKLNVKNIIDVLRELALMEKKTITRGDFVKLTKGDKSRKEDINEIKALWK